MTQEDKELLLKDLSARLLYGVKCKDQYGDYINVNIYNAHIEHLIDQIVPGVVQMVLHPMSSMTEEERKELNNQGYTKIAGELYHYCALSSNNAFYNPERHPYVRMEYVIKLIDWLNAHHFDYRGLIEKGLALEAPEGMYNIKEK